MAPKLTHVFTTRIELKADRMHALGPMRGAGGPHRFVADFASGYIESTPSCPHGLHPFKATIVGGADYLSLDTTRHVGHIDARGTVKVDGSETEMIYMHYGGVVHVDEAGNKALHWSKDAATTESKDHYWMVTPSYEVSSERLKWMEESIFVGHAHWYIPGDGRQFIEYEVYLVETG
jgi:hypothetical protein